MTATATATTTVAATTKLRYKTVSRDRQQLISWGSRDKAIEFAGMMARKSGEAEKVADIVTGEVVRVTPTGRIVDGHSVKVRDAKRPYYYKTINGKSARNQLRVNRQRVLVEGSRCKVDGVRGEFEFVRHVTSSTAGTEWVEVRAIERVDGREVRGQFRSFRPERVKTARGWN